ncbi:mitochondrial fission ELM1 family protein [Methyloferula stellata]|uniref:mitochondrial fission ELM1 family protein n=1 Tax=Methyloferula stellata TaxID=876270 RepID=UPI00035CF779|nr:mitochondrial fission ELM1 family protein [Methyloferula stellata]
MHDTPLLSPVTVWVLSDGKIGDETQCFGIAETLGVAAQRRLIAPRPLYAWLMPYGPIDPRDGPDRHNSPLAPPYPDIAIAAGRRTVAYLRYLKNLSGGRTFTIFMKDPYVGVRAADLIWVPQHDKLRGPNVIVTATPAHRIRSDLLAAARKTPDPQLAALPAPRIAMILGGPSTHHRYSQANDRELAAVARSLASQGLSVMVTGSRRTPPTTLAAVKTALAGAPGQHFIWDGTGGNPYVAMLALADAIFVTGDSVNMMAEAAATGVPVHIYEPDGGHPKMTAFIDHLIAAGAARRWAGKLEHWSYAPIDATPVIAAEIARRYLAWRGA